MTIATHNAISSPNHDLAHLGVPLIMPTEYAHQSCSTSQRLAVCTAVKKVIWFDPDLNLKVYSFGDHYGCVLRPTRSYTPRPKARVEKSIDSVQGNTLKL
jgi:hypothetical protein